MARLLLGVEREMTDKTKLDTPEDHDGGAGPGDAAESARNGATPAAEAASPPESAPIVDQLAIARKQANPPKPSLITAIEIENFKGIGAPVRIDLRPITLLFGRNSAGKSTIIQALCYAHEILSHGNVDVHKTELGGDQMDLGGFRQFVHRHETERTIRLRFELNLQEWRVPEPVWDAMIKQAHDPFAMDEPEWQEWLEPLNPPQNLRSCWVTLEINASGMASTPVLASYEVGVNDVLIGRIRASDFGAPRLALNWSHSLFGTFRPDVQDRSPATANRVAESSNQQTGTWQLLTAPLSSGQQTSLPDWNAVLSLSSEDSILKSFLAETTLPRGLNRQDLLSGPVVLLSGLLVGIGRTLRDELARLRYLGPLRALRPRTGGTHDPHQKGSWSNGSAAWDLLARHDSPAVRRDSDPLNAVNDWLSRGDRLNTRYKLRRRSTVELSADAVPVSEIRRHQLVFGKHVDKRGATDYDQWIHDTATMVTEETVVDLGELPTTVVDDVKVRIRKSMPDLEKLATTVDKLQRGQPRSSVRALVRAVAEAPIRTELELVTTASEVPVRTADVGVGISQILPVVVAALDPERPGITAIEQAELHVHPRMQVELGDLFAQGVDQGSIFLIETHSEHLLLRLMRRMRQTSEGTLPDGAPSLRPEDVSVLFVEPDGDQTLVRQMPLNERGELVKAWPGGFFEEDMREIFDMREQS